MKKLLILFTLFLIPLLLCAQYDITGDYKISGKLGLGTISPAFKLEANTAHTTNIDDEIRIGSYYRSNFYGLGLNYRINSSGGPSNHLVTYSGGTRYTALTFQINKIGIFTSNPGARLETGVLHAVNQDEEIRIGSYYQSNFYGLGLNYRINSSGGPSNHLVTYSGGTRYTTMTFVNGNIGIGTTLPGGYKLAVEGEIGAREVNVTLDSWSDFVFDEDYELMSLHELETYISRNKHLPDIPGKSEVRDKGVNLGEMNAKLLQKIEELTLYIIQYKKIQEEQARTVSELTKEIEILKVLINNLAK